MSSVRLDGPTPLALLHPDGFARRIRIIGDGCPPALAEPTAAAGPADLLIIAPGPEADGEWLDAARVALRELDRDGVAYLLTAAGDRRQLSGLARAAGLQVVEAMLHLPDVARTRQFVPVRRAPIRYTLGTLLAPSRSQESLAAAMLAVPAVPRFLARAFPSVGLVARGAGARPLLAWLAPEAHQPRVSTAMEIKLRPTSGSIVLHRLSGEGRAAVIAKIGLGTEAEKRASAEERKLRELGPSARAAGARVPSARMTRLGCGWPVVLLSVVEGESAARLLRTGRIGPAEVTEMIGIWLERWNRDTRRTERLGESELVQEVLGPVEQVAHRIEQGAAYLDWLRRRCAAIQGRELPMVAAHNDLTAVNVLLSANQGLGVVDWESASDQDLPLRDLWYAAVDAETAASTDGDRLRAFRRCFLERTPLAGLLDRLAGSLQRNIGASPEFAEVCFHAGWARHAVAESRKRFAGQPTPFLDIVRCLAREGPAKNLAGSAS